MKIWRIRVLSLCILLPKSNGICASVLYHTHSRAHTRTHARTLHTRTHWDIHARTHAHTHARTHVRTHTQTHIQALTYTRTHARTHTHTHTHTQTNKTKQKLIHTRNGSVVSFRGMSVMRERYLEVVYSQLYKTVTFGGAFRV